MSHHPKGDGSRERQQLAQTQADEAVTALQDVAHQAEIDRIYDLMAKWTPACLHGELRRFLQAEAREGQLDLLIAPRIDSENLCLVQVVMRNVSIEHASSKDQCNSWNIISARWVIWPVIRYVLQNPRTCHRWLDIAWLAVADYTTDREEAARLMTEYLRSDSAVTRELNELCPNALWVLDQRSNGHLHGTEWAKLWCLANTVRNASRYASLTLSKIAPTTPGLIEALREATADDWFVSCYLQEEGISGADAARAALVHLRELERVAVRSSVPRP